MSDFDDFLATADDVLADWYGSADAMAVRNGEVQTDRFFDWLPLRHVNCLSSFTIEFEQVDPAFFALLTGEPIQAVRGGIRYQVPDPPIIDE